jgi:micrococcal nuclease
MVRYIGIQAPYGGDFFSAEATHLNWDLVLDQTVFLEKDVSETDANDALLRYVYLADGTFVNAEIVRQGYARAVAREPNTRRQEELVAAEEEAKAAGRGLWSDS